MEQPILLALTSIGSAIVTTIVPRLFNKKKDAVDMFAEIQEKLYTEIDRLEKKIIILEQKEHNAFLLEEKLIKRIVMKLLLNLQNERISLLPFMDFHLWELMYELNRDIIQQYQCIQKTDTTMEYIFQFVPVSFFPSFNLALFLFSLSSVSSFNLALFLFSPSFSASVSS